MSCLSAAAAVGFCGEPVFVVVLEGVSAVAAGRHLVAVDVVGEALGHEVVAQRRYFGRPVQDVVGDPPAAAGPVGDHGPTVMLRRAKSCNAGAQICRWLRSICPPYPSWPSSVRPIGKQLDYDVWPKAVRTTPKRANRQTFVMFGCYVQRRSCRQARISKTYRWSAPRTSKGSVQVEK